jgi:hypothetical protein
MKEKNEASDAPMNPNAMPMIDLDTFEHYAKSILDMAAELRDTKHKLYFSTNDVVRSFKKCAQIRNKALPPMIADLMAKHFQSISDMVDSEFGPEETIPVDAPHSLEAWDEKFIDLLNYTLKLYSAIRVIRGF